MALPPEAAQLREEALALVQKLNSRKELTNLQLHTIITYRGQLHLSCGIMAMRLQRLKSRLDFGAIQFVGGRRVVQFAGEQLAQQVDDRAQKWLSQDPELANTCQNVVINMNVQVDTNAQTLQHVLRKGCP
jgi:hypothetical protein